MRIGLGPVFLYECLANSRRWQTYAIRSVGVAIVLVAMTTIATSHASQFPTNPWRSYAELGASYFYAIVGIELTLVLLAAPAATAGAICVDRARGTLTHMLATDLSDPEIVLGKLAARLLPILGLIACSWPVLAISSLLGGIDPTALTLAFAIILAVALVGCTMAMALSVWAKKPHEVVLVTYTFWMFVLLLWPIWFALSIGKVAWAPAQWSLVADPYYLAFAPYAAPNRVGFWDYFGFFAVSLALSALLSAVAIRRMRPVAARGTVDHRKEPRVGLVGRITRWLPGPSLDGNPVLWREWHRSRPSRWLMFLILIVGGATSIACVGGAASIWANGLDGFQRNPRPWTIAGVYGYLLQMIFGFLMISAVAPMAMSEERQRGSLDLLATTTLSTPTIVIGKWLGTLRLALLLAIGPGLVGLALATAHSTPPSASATPGIGADSFTGLTQGELLFGAGLLVMTLLIHGMLLSTIGLALAVWIKRQSRAIAACVAIAVIVYAGWPMLIGLSRSGPAGMSMMNLSPIVAGMSFVETLAMGRPRARAELWWISFWDLECLVLSLGLLWLTIRTFDGCFGRIPERPRRASFLSDVVVILGALVGAGGLFGAIAIGIIGLRDYQAGQLFEELNMGIVATALLVAVGLLLLSAQAPLSIVPPRTPRTMALEPSPKIPNRRLFMLRWWESFRLVLLLAIGPALIGLALVTVPKPARVVPEETTLPDGSRQRIASDSSGNTYVTTTPLMGSQTMRFATAEEIAARPVLPGPSGLGLSVPAGLAILAILAQGAAVVSVGLALGLWFRRRGPAMALSAGLFLFATIGWPLVLLNGGPGLSDHQGLAMSSSVPTIVELLRRIVLYDLNGESLWWWTAFWIIEYLALSLGLLWRTLRTLDGRFGRNPERPRFASVLADVVVVLAGLLGAGGLFGSIALWIYGVGAYNQDLELGVLACSLLIAVAFFLLSVWAPWSISRAGTPQSLARDPSVAIPERRLLVARWRESFRLVPLLAIGPALIGLALATVQRSIRVVPNVTTLPDGTTETIWTDPSGTTYVTTTGPPGLESQRDATDAEIAARPVRTRAGFLTAALLAVLTVLAHGIAVVSFGLALGVGIRRRGSAIAASSCLYLLVAVGWPILCLYVSLHTHTLHRPAHPGGWVLASPVPAIALLLRSIYRDDVVGEFVRWATFWDVLFLLLAAVVSALAIWTLGRRSRTQRFPAGEAGDERPLMESVLMGD